MCSSKASVALGLLTESRFFLNVLFVIGVKNIVLEERASEAVLLRMHGHLVWHEVRRSLDEVGKPGKQKVLDFSGHCETAQT